jgi:Cof subfamily protein (haloacid dehalogenase superfamily)
VIHPTDPLAGAWCGLPRLIATDLDGTLLGMHAVTRRSALALHRADAAGIAIVLVTGRAPRRLQQVYADLGAFYPAICANGAIVYDPVQDRVLASSPMAQAVVRDVCLRLRARVPEVLFAAEVDSGRRLVHEPGWPMRDNANVAAYAGGLDDMTDGPVLKLLARAPGRHSDSFNELVRSTVGDLVEATYSSYTGLIEMSQLGVTKATTLARFATELGILPADALTFGDMPNDISMLRWSGRSVAVANADPLVLTAARETTASHLDDGVAAYLERLLDHAGPSAPPRPPDHHRPAIAAERPMNQGVL